LRWGGSAAGLVDLLLSRESDFSERKLDFKLEKTIVQKGKLLYEQ
jgi:hypothetical protein